MADIQAVSVDQSGEGETSRVIAATASDDKTIRLWSIADGVGQPPVPFGKKIFRVPIGPCAEGRVYAVALSLKTGLLAAGGYFGVAHRSPYILILDLWTGEIRMRLRLDGKPFYSKTARVRTLAFSPDGSKLAAGIDDKGAAVWRTDDWSLLLKQEPRRVEDEDCQWCHTNAVAWSASGFFASARGDGRIRVYEPDLKQNREYWSAGDAVRAHKVQSSMPQRIAFSPDGKRFAVGYQCYQGRCEDHTLLTIHRTSDPDEILGHFRSSDDAARRFDLKHVSEEERNPQTYGLESVAWSADGKTLYAGGTAPARGLGGLRFVYAFDTRAKLLRVVAPDRADANTVDFTSGISDIARLPDAKDGTGRILAVSTDSLIQVLTTGEDVHSVTVAGPGIDLRSQSDGTSSNNGHLCVSADGKRLTFPHEWPHFWKGGKRDFPCSGSDGDTTPASAAAEPLSEAYAVVSLTGARPSVAVSPVEPPVAFGVAAPVAGSVAGLDIRRSGNGRLIYINNVKATIGERERVVAYAISPEDRTVVVATPFQMTAFAAKSPSAAPVQMWSADFETGPARINVVGQGGKRLVVVGFENGIVRWYRLRDGKELLALYVTNEKVAAGDDMLPPRWILWTPEGYYDASPGAEDLIGWHINRGVDLAPVFYDINRFREEFNRPDVVREVLRTQDVALAAQAMHADYFKGVTDGKITPSLAPKIVIIPPPAGTPPTNPLTVHYKLDWRNIPTLADRDSVQVRAYINGRPRPITVKKIGEDEYEATITGIPVGEPVELSLVPLVPVPRSCSPDCPAGRSGLPPDTRLVMVSKRNAASDGSPEIRIAAVEPTPLTAANFRGGEEASQPVYIAGTPAPKVLYALLFGVSEYGGEQDLPAVREDVRHLRAALDRQQYLPNKVFDKVIIKAYPEEDRKFLKKGEAPRPEPSKSDITAGLKWVVGEVNGSSGNNAVGLVYFAGHGAMEGAQDSKHFVFQLKPVFSDPDKSEVSISTISDEIDNMEGGRIILIIDACDSGRAALHMENLNKISVNAKGSRKVVITATSLDDPGQTNGREALERDSKSGGYGLLTQGFILGMKMAYPDPKQHVSFTYMDSYLSTYVSTEASKVGKHQNIWFLKSPAIQTEPLMALDPDLPI